MTQSSNNTRLTLLASMLFLVGILGLADALYLTVLHYQGAAPTCLLLHGCDLVTTSVYSKIFGIPVALLGVVYYATILVLSLISALRQSPRVFRWTCLFTCAGILASSWFVYAQLAIIKSICLYCMGSAASSTILFVFGMVGLKTIKK